MKKYLLLIVLLMIVCLGCVAATGTSSGTFNQAARAAWVSALGIKPHQEFYESPTGNNYWDHLFPMNAPYTMAEAEAKGVGIGVLGDNYQYQSYTSYGRTRCPVSRSAAELDPLENGSYFFIVDASNSLIPITLPETFKQKQYIKVIKEMGKVVKTEQITVNSVGRTSYEYWPGGEYIRYQTIQRYDNKKQLLKKMVVEYDAKGQVMYDITYDGQGQKRSMVTYEAGILKEEFIFDAEGYKTNHVIYGPLAVEANRSYDREGNVIAVTQEYPEAFLPVDIFAKPDCSGSL